MLAKPGFLLSDSRTAFRSLTCILLRTNLNVRLRHGYLHGHAEHICDFAPMRGNRGYSF